MPAGKTTLSDARVARVFVTVFTVLLLVPLVAIPVAGASASAEKRELAAWPVLTTENGTPNLSYFSQAGTWFEDHFAFCSQLVDADATVREQLFATSATDNVVVGRVGWLYYAGTLDDYRRENQLSDRAIDNIAWNLALMEEYVHSLGKGFVVMISPNKNSLYPEQMPYYEPAGEGASNLERLKEAISGKSITWIDLSSELLAADHPLYLERDSHWTNEGALVGYRALCAALGREADPYAGEAPSTEWHEGDVEGMLHPSNPRLEEQPLWPDAQRFAYTNEATSVEDGVIETKSKVEWAEGALICYRDSFGNALIPYLASDYATATFTKMVPYDMSPMVIDQVDDVVIERVECHLSLFNSDVPYMPTPERKDVSWTASTETISSINASENGPYFVFEGTIETGMSDDGTPIYVTLTLSDGSKRVFEAFHVGPASDERSDSQEVEEEKESNISSDWGYRAFVWRSLLGGLEVTNAQLITAHDGETTEVLSRQISIGG